MLSQSFNELAYRPGSAAGRGIFLDRLHNGTAYDNPIGKAAGRVELLRVGNPEAHSNRQPGELSQPLDQSFGIIGQLLLGPGDSCARYCIHKAA
jgi:hypothetical protein